MGCRRVLFRSGGEVDDRRMEQAELIRRPGADRDALRELWSPFIHTHHCEFHESFYESWITKHPRRSLEAYFNQYVEAKLIEDNPVPSDLRTVEELVAWYEPLIDAERRFMYPARADVSEDLPPN